MVLPMHNKVATHFIFPLPLIVLGHITSQLYFDGLCSRRWLWGLFQKFGWYCMITLISSTAPQYKRWICLVALGTDAQVVLVINLVFFTLWSLCSKLCSSFPWGFTGWKSSQIRALSVMPLPIREKHCETNRPTEHGHAGPSGAAYLLLSIWGLLQDLHLSAQIQYVSVQLSGFGFHYLLFVVPFVFI